MKRRSSGANVDTASETLIEKWYAPNVPDLTERAKWPEIQTSYVEFEDLNKLGRFSYNKFNKDVEVTQVLSVCKLKTYQCHTEAFYGNLSKEV